MMNEYQIVALMQLRADLANRLLGHGSDQTIHDTIHMKSYNDGSVDIAQLMHSTRIDGSVMLTAMIDSDGNVTNLLAF